jgi:OPA family glycerol-3-phosphate transporter-like MFS transporter
MALASNALSGGLSDVPPWAMNLLAIVLLLGAVALMVRRLPNLPLGHSPEFIRRRRWNWVPLGLAYAFLYMGRYNLTVAKVALGDRMTKEDFGTIFFWGTLVYGLSFVVNGPLTDRLGGRKTMLFATGGAALANVLMGLAITDGSPLSTLPMVPLMSGLYALNMYFQSFGAVSIVKVNAHWFHVRERGTFGGIFGILIALGIYFAYDWSQIIVDHAPLPLVFHAPALLLVIMLALTAVFVRDTPSEAGFNDFDPMDASSGSDGKRLPVFTVAAMMLKNPVVVTIACIEFCSGYLRQAIMQWGKIFAAETGSKTDFVPANWGLLLCVAGICGGMFAGVISDHIFQSRRGPAAGILYAIMLLGSVAMVFLLGNPALGWLLVFMSLAIIGVHGMLSGTASMDFGGRHNVGVAVGLIDGMVYLGTAAQALVLGELLPSDKVAQRSAENWSTWPLLMLPVALVGFALTLKIWNAKPASRAGVH